MNELEHKLAQLEELIASPTAANCTSEGFDAGRTTSEKSNLESLRFVGPDTSAKYVLYSILNI